LISKFESNLARDHDDGVSLVAVDLIFGDSLLTGRYATIETFPFCLLLD